ncbi:MAG: pyridoxal-phosphate dependent enzyme [Chloroflexota bacterium]
MVAVTADLIRAAHARVPAAFRDSPQFIAEALSERAGVPVIVKVESANPIGCFKGRGTWLAVSELVARGAVGEGRGLVVASAGNFGQGVAFAARAMQVPVVVYAATTANTAKVAAMRRLGAEVRLVGEDFDAAREAAAEVASQGAALLLVDGADPWISIGAGGIGLELTDGVDRGELPPITDLLVPVGNGALIGGIGAWIKAVAPTTRVVGVQAAQAPAMTLSWRAGRPIETERADTVADGIAARVPVPLALELMLAAVDEMRLVEEAEIIAATAEMAAALPFTVEPSAGAAWAAALQQPRAGAIALVMTGGNVAPP